MDSNTAFMDLNKAAEESGFMVVPVWDEGGENIVWDDPFIGSSPPASNLPSDDVCFTEPAILSTSTSSTSLGFKNGKFLCNEPKPKIRQDSKLSFNKTTPKNLGWWEESTNALEGMIKVTSKEEEEEMAVEAEVLGDMEAYPGEVYEDECLVDEQSLDERNTTNEELLDKIYEEVKHLIEVHEVVIDEDPTTELNDDWWLPAETEIAAEEPDRVLGGISESVYIPNRLGSAQIKIENESDSNESVASSPYVVRIHKQEPIPKRYVGKVCRGRIGKKAPRRDREAAMERKKEQNRVAATRYRDKKKAIRDTILQELTEAEYQNHELRKKEESLSHEIQYLKGLMKQIKSKRKDGDRL